MFRVPWMFNEVLKQSVSNLFKVKSGQSPFCGLAAAFVSCELWCVVWML